MTPLNTKSPAGTAGEFGNRLDTRGGAVSDSYFITNGASVQTVNPAVAALLAAAVLEREPDLPMLGRAWPLRSLVDACKERPPVEYVVAGLFALPSLNILYGPPGSLKSMLLAEIAVCVASGRPWLTPLPNQEGAPFPVKQRPVLWIDLDNGRRRTDDRFAALAWAHELPLDTPIHYISMPSPWPDLSKPDMVGSMIELVKFLGVGLVTIDNLGLVTGNAAENDSEMAGVMGNLRLLAEETGAAVVVIHHQRKGADNGRKGDSLRGHSSIEAALDLALRIEREEDSSTILVESTKVRGVDVPKFGAMFAYDHAEGTTELKSARFYRVAVDTSGSDRNIDDEILSALALQTMNQKDLLKAVREALEGAERKPGRDRILARIAYLGAQGKVHIVAGERNNEKLYSRK